MIESISAITLATEDMARAVRFYTMLGFEPMHGGGAEYRERARKVIAGNTGLALQ